MTSVSLASEEKARSEIERSPSVFFVLCDDGADEVTLETLYAVLMPQDAGRFRVWDDDNGFDVFFKLRGRWHRVNAAWMQLKKRNLDPAENRSIAIVTFGRKILKDRYGVKKWKPKGERNGRQ